MPEAERAAPCAAARARTWPSATSTEVHTTSSPLLATWAFPYGLQVAAFSCLDEHDGPLRTFGPPCPAQALARLPPRRTRWAYSLDNAQPLEIHAPPISNAVPISNACVPNSHGLWAGDARVHPREARRRSQWSPTHHASRRRQVIED